MGRILNKHAALLFAEKLSEGMNPTQAYRAIKPNVTPGSAAVMGARYAKNLMVREHSQLLTERASEAGILGRQQIQEMLSLAAVTPKDRESLSLPENAWLIESDTGAGVRGISSLDALRELSKISGHYSPPNAVAGKPAHSLADCEDYREMLEAELGMAKAFSGRLSENAQVEAVDQEKSDHDSEALSLDWLDEIE